MIFSVQALKMETDGSVWLDIAGVEEVPDGSLKEVSAGGARLVVANHGGNFYAFQAECPHMGGPLVEGALVGAQIECPWHRYLYDLATGENHYPRSILPAEFKRSLTRLRTHQIRCVSGRLEVKLASESA
jgi:nitrite reductase/ring-hydroxylating ferredoxin subunit